MDPVDLQVRNAEERGRYELVRDGEVVGIADYRIEGDEVVFPHTEIRSDLRGQGLGEVLVRASKTSAAVATGLAPGDAVVIGWRQQAGLALADT